MNKYFTRAEKLAEGKDPSRAYALGSIMNSMGFAKRSIALLEYALEKASHEIFRRDTLLKLFSSYLGTGDWKSAEEVFFNVYTHMSWRDVPRRYSGIAVVAAKAGAKDDALRIWKRAVNVKPTEMEYLKELSEAGLKSELVSFYRDLSKKMPTSVVPSNALKILAQK